MIQNSTMSGDRFNVANAIPVRRPWRWLSTVVVAFLFIALVVGAAKNKNLAWDVVAQWFFAANIVKGVGVTILLTVIAMSLGIVFGAVVAALRISSNPLISYLAGGYVWLFRAIPQLVQILFWFNIAILFPRLSFTVPFGGPTLFDLNMNDVISPFAAAVIALTIIETAYMAEIVRGGLFSVDRGQTDAAMSLGMSKKRCLLRIILPQALKFMTPPTGNNIIRMVKATALVSVIGMGDLLYSAQIVYHENFQTIPLLLVTVGWYLIINTVLFFVQSWIERRANRDSGGAHKSQPQATIATAH